MVGSVNKCYLTVLVSKVTHGKNLGVLWNFKGEIAIIIGHGAVLKLVISNGDCCTDKRLVWQTPV